VGRHRVPDRHRHRHPAVQRLVHRQLKSSSESISFGLASVAVGPAAERPESAVEAEDQQADVAVHRAADAAVHRAAADGSNAGLITGNR